MEARISKRGRRIEIVQDGQVIDRYDVDRTYVSTTAEEIMAARDWQPQVNREINNIFQQMGVR